MDLGSDLEADLERLAEDKRQRTLNGERPVFWSWEQPLRGIYHSVRGGGPLRRLILIASHESVRQSHLFYSLVRRYSALKEVTVEILVPDGHGARLLEASDQPLDAHFGWDFEDFDEMWRAVSLLLDQLAIHEGIADREIAVDLTGGPKPATVVAATATINREVRNQYVHTNPKDPQASTWEYEVLDYDLILGNPGGWW